MSSEQTLRDELTTECSTYLTQKTDFSTKRANIVSSRSTVLSTDGSFTKTQYDSYVTDKANVVASFNNLVTYGKNKKVTAIQLYTILNAPNAPTNLAVTGSTSSTLTITFTASNTSGVTSYTVVATPATGGAITQTFSGSTTYIVTGLSSNTSYTLTLKANNSTSSSGSSSSVVQSTADSGTKMLLHFDGGNNSTTFVDSGPNALTGTAISGASQSTDLFKFGVSSLKPGTSGQGLARFTDMTPINSSDFTVEGWYNFNGSPGPLWSISGQLVLRFFATFSCFIITFDIGTGEKQIYWPVTISNSTWYHIAVVRSSGTVSFYLNGTRVSKWTARPDDSESRTESISGTQMSVYDYYNYVDEFRVSTAARYTGNFTPPTEAFS